AIVCECLRGGSEAQLRKLHAGTYLPFPCVGCFVNASEGASELQSCDSRAFCPLTSFWKRSFVSACEEESEAQLRKLHAGTNLSFFAWGALLMRGKRKACESRAIMCVLPFYFYLEVAVCDVREGKCGAPPRNLRPVKNLSNSQRFFKRAQTRKVCWKNRRSGMCGVLQTNDGHCLKSKSAPQNGALFNCREKSEKLQNKIDGVHNTTAVAVFIVVPRKDLCHVANRLS
ncbi:MAG: hypothetical protein PWP37_1580, partial [Thermotogota bacterium]|nr:hypothetical protein [Thermotogota bacterium]